MLAQSLLATRSTGDLGTACAIVGACAVHGFEAADFRVLRVDGRSGSLRCIENSGTETPYLADHGGPVERAVRGETSIYETGANPDALTERSLWSEPPGAMAAVTLEASGSLQGLLLVAFGAPREFDASDRMFLQALGDTLGLSLERDRLRQELGEERRRKDQLERERSQEEEASSNLMSVVAHEIRTPLTAIKAYTEALLENLKNDRAPRERFLGIINDECDRLTRLVTDILDLSKLEAGQRPLRLTRFKLHELITEALESLSPVSQGRQIDMQIDVPDDLTPEADRDLVRQLLVNLVGNAIKFSPPSSRVQISGRDRGESWVLSVQDEGPGIPEDDLTQVFERFFRARQAGETEVDGTGLGLAISRGIVDLHGGRIWVETVEPHGSRFCFELPIRQLASTRARRIARQVWSREDVRELFEQTVGMVAAAMQAEIVSMMLVDPERGDLFIAASRGLEGQNLLGRRTTVRSGVAGTVAAWGRPLLVNNIETDRRFRRLNHPQYSTKSLLCVPLRVDGEVLGVLNVNNKVNGESFDEDDLSVLSVLVERVGSAVERAGAHPESARLVADAIEAVRSITRLRRDSALGGQDLVRQVRALAREMHMTESEVDVIGYVASIHDVGMTSLPHVMSDAHPLGAAQRREMESHPEVSLEILRPLEYLGSVRDVILSHHENWNGTGYPRGLKGEEILLGARVLAVADAFDSMVRGRPYRTARSRDEALEELRCHAGTQFDPAVVDALARVLARDEAVAA
jgi:signal transduction histidine kinase